MKLSELLKLGGASDEQVKVFEEMYPDARMKEETENATMAAGSVRKGFVVDCLIRRMAERSYHKAVAKAFFDAWNSGG